MIRCCSPRTAAVAVRSGKAFQKTASTSRVTPRGLGRRRPDISVTILRLANMIGPAMETTLSRYLAGPLVPTVLGRDARLQLLHEQDALGALERAVMVGKSGTFNIGASGIIMLSQAIRRAGRVALPVPGFGLAALDSLRKANRLPRDQPRATRLLELRPSDGHHPDGTRARIPPQVVDCGGFLTIMCAAEV